MSEYKDPLQSVKDRLEYESSLSFKLKEAFKFLVGFSIPWIIVLILLG